MASYNKFNQFVKDLADAKHNFSSDIFKVMLTNVAPTADNKVLTDLTEIAAGNGYIAGGTATAITDSVNAGIAKEVGTNVVFTASGGTIGPLRYAVLYNATSATKALVAWWDYGSSVTLNNTETMSVAFDATNGIFQIS